MIFVKCKMVYISEDYNKTEKPFFLKGLFCFYKINFISDSPESPTSTN